jgi:catechol 2,3-dioxygenase-like lactoylglutathione lyase family enzyme
MTKPSVRFQRANFVVRDLDAALKFYVDVLGLSVDLIKTSEKTSYSYTVFDIPRSAPIRFAVLSAPGQPRVMALTEIQAPLPPKPHPRSAAIVLEMPDVDAAMDRARAKGFEIIPEAVLLTQDGRTGREIGLIDADDHLIVIYTISEPAH